MEEKHSDLYLCCSKSRGDVVKESFKEMLEKGMYKADLFADL